MHFVEAFVLESAHSFVNFILRDISVHVQRFWNIDDQCRNYYAERKSTV